MALGGVPDRCTKEGAHVLWTSGGPGGFLLGPVRAGDAQRFEAGGALAFLGLVEHGQVRRGRLGEGGEQLLDVGPVAGAGDAVGTGERGLGGYPLGEGEEPPAGNGVGAPDGGGQVETIEPCKIGLEELPPVNEELAEAYDSGAAIP